MARHRLHQATLAQRAERAEARALLLAELPRLVSAIPNTLAVKVEAQTSTAAVAVVALVAPMATALLVHL